MMIVSALAGAILVYAMPSVPVSPIDVERVEVGYSELSAGQPEAAIARINASADVGPDDPSALINLAAANARLGRVAEARRLLHAARLSNERYDMELADGTWMDSRNAARIAISQLDRRQVLATR